MTRRKISPNSLKNLIQSNKEANSLTRESLETALLFLLQKKELASITISELVRIAGVSRNAFYRNYKSKEEILRNRFGKATEMLIERWHTLQPTVRLSDIQETFGLFLEEQKNKLRDRLMTTKNC